MDAFFIKLLNTSISASWLVLAVLIFRFLLKKSPRWIHVALWALVAVRLLCPISFESALSLIPSGETIPQTIVYAEVPAINSGVPVIDRVVNDAMAGSLTPVPGASANPIQIHLFLQAQIWCLGILAMLAWAAVSYFRLRRRVAAAVVLEQGVHICDYIDTPFILGIFKPVIYLPSAMDTNSTSHVLAHERAHIARKDHWWKPLGYLILSIHWFNPMMWLAYILFCRDIELACDERVIQNMAGEQKKAYSEALLHCSVSRRAIAACPLAFGEVGVKERVKTVLHYRKPAFWVVLVAVIALIGTAACFLTDLPEKIDDNTAQWFEEYAYEQVKDRMDRDDVACVAGNADYALVYCRGDDPELTLYRYERQGGQIAILEACTGVCADEAGMSLNHLEYNGKHIYFGTISEYHWNSAVETTTWINWDYLTFTDARGRESKQDMTGRDGFLFLLDAPAVDFQAVDGLGTVCLDMEKYREQGYSMKETEFYPLGYREEFVGGISQIDYALKEFFNFPTDPKGENSDDAYSICSGLALSDLVYARVNDTEIVDTGHECAIYQDLIDAQIEQLLDLLHGLPETAFEKAEYQAKRDRSLEIYTQQAFAPPYLEFILQDDTLYFLYHTDYETNHQCWKIRSDEFMEFLESIYEGDKSNWVRFAPNPTADGEITFSANGAEVIVPNYLCFRYEQTGDGIRFKPEDQSGWVRLKTSPGPLEIDSSDLRVQTGVYCGNQAQWAYSESPDIWRYLTVTIPYGDEEYYVLLLNEDEDAWVKAYDQDITWLVKNLVIQGNS